MKNEAPPFNDVSEKIINIVEEQKKEITVFFFEDISYLETLLASMELELIIK